MPEPVQVGIQVWYVEARFPGALDALGVVLDRLRASSGFLGGELLTSPAQAGLALLHTRWQGAPPPAELPDGARGWVFHVVGLSCCRQAP